MTGGRADPDFRRLWGAHAVSTLGDQVTLVALPIAVFSRTHSALQVGLVAAMPAMSAVVLGLLAGAAADRWRHQPVLVATDLARGAVLGVTALAVVAFPRTYPLWILYTAAILLGTLRVLHDAAAVAVLPQVVAAPGLLRANGALNASESAGNALGPGLAGALISVGGAALAFATDAATFLASAVGVGRLRGLRYPSPPAAPSERTRSGPSSVFSEIADGIRVLRADREVIWSLRLVAAMNILAVAAEAHFIPYARTVLHVGNWAIGGYFALGGMAGLLTAAAVRRHTATRGDVMVAGVAIFGLGVLAAGLFPSPVTAGLTYVGAGVGGVLTLTHFYALRQRRFPVAVLGRIAMASRIVLYGAMAFGFIAGGALSRAAGPAALFVAAGLVGLSGAVVASVSGLTRLRIDEASGELGAVLPLVG
ncbi:MAG: MFS transporter [Acidimicrobiales bacterium]